jgi:RNA polymerase sigma-70 factor (ECF subfamily)
MERTGMERLVEEYSDMIFRIAFHNVGNRAEAEDITQNVFLKLMEKAPPFEDREHERAWIIRVTLNLCRDWFRSPWHRRRAGGLEDLENTPSPSREPGEGSEVLAAVLALPVRYRNVVYLYYYEDLPLARIAAILDAREGTVASWLHRARKRLRIALEGGFDDDQS